MERASKRRRWLRMALVPAAAGALALIDGLLHASRDVRRFEYVPEALTEQAYRDLARRPGWAADTFEPVPGVALRGLVRRPAAEGAPWVLFFAGNGGGLLAESQAFLEGLRGDHDWGMAVFAYRGFDGSGGDARREGIVADAAPLFRHVCASQRVPPARVHVVGFSLGTNVAASLVASGVGAASLSLLAPLTVIEVVPPSMFRRWVRGDVYDTRPLLDKLPPPVLLVHGAQDVSLPITMGRELATGLGPRGRFVEIPGVDHMGLLASESARDAVRAMVNERRSP